MAKIEFEGKHQHECGTFEAYNDFFDCFFCPTCDIWLEDHCKDPTCSYCRERPEKPSDTDE